MAYGLCIVVGGDLVKYNPVGVAIVSEQTDIGVPAGSAFY